MRFETQTALALEAAFSRLRRGTHYLRWRARMAGAGGLRARAVRAGGRARAGVAKAQRAPFSGSPRQAAHLSDSLRIGGPERLGLFARRPFAQALVRVDAPERGGSGEPAHDLEARERALRSRLLPDGRSPLRSLPHRARERRRSEEGALGLRLDRRSHPRRSGRLLLPRLLQTAHLPSPARLRRPDGALDLRALEGGQHPWGQLGCGPLEARRRPTKSRSTERLLSTRDPSRRAFLRTLE